MVGAWPEKYVRAAPRSLQTHKLRSGGRVSRPAGRTGRPSSIQQRRGTNPGTGAAMINPFDLKTVLLARHAQHVVLIHFPIALFITAVAFDFVAQWTKRQNLCGRRLLQPASGSDFNATGSRNRSAGLAASTRGPDVERHSVVAPGTWVRLKRDDLAGVVDAFPRPTAGGSLAALPPGG